MNMEEQDNVPVTEQDKNGQPVKSTVLSFKDNPTRYITVTAMVTALALVVMLALRIKTGFLTFDFKDVVIAIGGFIFGPLVAVFAAILVPLIEMLSVSDTLFWGMFMNILSSVAFCLTASLIYRKMRSLKGAIIGLAAGVLAMTIIMIPANIVITPIYTKAPLDVVMGMLLPMIIPFNLLKASINAAVIMMIYKPLVRAFRAAKMLPDGKSLKESGKKTNIITLVVSAAVVLIVVLLIALWVSQNGLSVDVNPA